MIKPMKKRIQDLNHSQRLSPFNMHDLAKCLYTTKELNSCQTMQCSVATNNSNKRFLSPAFTLQTSSEYNMPTQTMTIVH